MRLLADSSFTFVVVIVAAVIYVAVLWIALAFYVVRDARLRSTSSAFVAFSTFLGFVPPFLGALIYVVVRPRRTMEEERALAIEEQMFLDPVDNTPVMRPCPSCGREIEEDFVVCPYCRTQFSRRCVNCDRVLRLGWAICPFCATDVGVPTLQRPTRSAS